MAKFVAEVLPEKLRHNLPDWIATALHEQLAEEDFWPLVRARHPRAVFQVAGALQNVLKVDPRPEQAWA